MKRVCYKDTILSKEEVNTIIDLYVNKEISYIKIGKEFKTNGLHIRGILKENNIEIRKRGGHSKIKFSKEELNEIIDLYENQRIGSTIISKKFNCSLPVILRILDENNIKIKPNGYFCKGRPNLRKGKTKENDEVFRKISEGVKKTRNLKEWKETVGKEAIRKQIERYSIKDENGKSINNPFYGQKHTDEYVVYMSEIKKIFFEENPKEREKMSNRMKERHKNGEIVLPLKDTKIELKIQNFLTLLKIEFFTHKYMNIKHSYQCDILIPEQVGIPQKTIIEADGDYWHGNKEIFADERLTERIINQRELDNNRTKELLEKGFNVIRIWEDEINKMKLEDFRLKLQEVK